MGRKAKIVVDELIKAMMDRPQDFRIGEHTMDDKKSGMQFWIANTRFDGGVYHPYTMKFGMRQSWRFHRALKSLKAYKAATAIRGGSQRLDSQ